MCICLSIIYTDIIHITYVIYMFLTVLLVKFSMERNIRSDMIHVHSYIMLMCIFIEETRYTNESIQMFHAFIGLIKFVSNLFLYLKNLRLKIDPIKVKTFYIYIKHKEIYKIYAKEMNCYKPGVRPIYIYICINFIDIILFF